MAKIKFPKLISFLGMRHKIRKTLPRVLSTSQKISDGRSISPCRAINILNEFSLHPVFYYNILFNYLSSNHFRSLSIKLLIITPFDTLNLEAKPYYFYMGSNFI